jgi:hypothetical protein
MPELEVKMESVYVPSEDIVARDVAGETIIVPLVAGIGDLEDDLFTFNETGQAIWHKLDGVKSLREVVEDLAKEYQADSDTMEKEVRGLVTELLKRRFVVEAASA